MANRFDKLESSDFPHLDNVDVYKYDNSFNYSRFDAPQMELQICSVPWDVGEAHVGQRTISGIGNVVYFETEAKRDAWFNAIPDDECYRFETKYKELHRDYMIDVPLPFDVAARFNYLVVRYNLFANDSSPVQYENKNGVRNWFWFIRDVEFVAPNTTRLHLLDDAFQTWIYSVNFSGMILERGHAPMFATDVNDYLANPVANNDFLLTEDVNFGSASTVRHIDAIALNAGDMYACIATSANPAGTWGDKASNNWHTPASAYYYQDGVLSCRVFAVAVADLDEFLANITNSFPQFKQTVQGVFFVSSQLLTLGSQFSFGGVTCYNVSATRQTINLSTLNKSQFGYPTNYSNIAKLYTSPYAHIEITDENGETTLVKIEDSTGTLDVHAAVNLAYPFVSIDANISGIGGNASKSIQFRNVNAKTFAVSGAWYETVKSWQVPTFAVILDASREYDYSSHFDRAQRVIDYTTTTNNKTKMANVTLANTNASADTAQANTATMALADKTNQDESADTQVSNTAINVAANTSIQQKSAETATGDTTLANALSQAIQAYNAGYTRDTVNNEVNAEYASAAVGAAGTVAGGILSAVTGGGPGALIDGAISGATSIAQTAIAANLKSTQAEAAISNSQAQVTATNNNNVSRTSNQNGANGDIVGYTNTAQTGVTANNAATQKANATRSQTASNTAAANTAATQKANATRFYNAEIENATRSRRQAENAITNDIAQAALRQPFIFGSFSNGDTATTKPIALFSHVVTQSRNAIKSAGDEFLRYGYRLDMQWNFTGFNIGKYFTYWKLRDFWVTNLNVPDLYMDKLRFFLFGGVTVWRRPEDIGKHSIYENWPD